MKKIMNHCSAVTSPYIKRMLSIRRKSIPSFEYADDATEYVNTVQDFTNEFYAISQETPSRMPKQEQILKKNWN